MLGWLGGKQTVVSAICELTTLNFTALRIHFILMAKSDHCAVWEYDNDRRYPEKYFEKDHIAEFDGSLSMRFWSCKSQNYSIWSRMINREVIGKGSRNALFQVGKYTSGCFNHFAFGRSTDSSPHPTLYLRGYNRPRGPPKSKRRRLHRTNSHSSLEWSSSPSASQ